MILDETPLRMIHIMPGYILFQIILCIYVIDITGKNKKNARTLIREKTETAETTSVLKN